MGNFTKGRRLALGKRGEEIAKNYLLSHGYKILEQNFKARYGEIDIVAKEGSVLVFVEVKTRYSESFGPPEEAVTPWKIKSIIKTAQFYKLIHPNLPEELRIDVIAVSLSPTDGGVEKIKLIKNVTG